MASDSPLASGPVRIVLVVPRPAGGKVAVKAINHLGDEVMRVFDV